MSTTTTTIDVGEDGAREFVDVPAELGPGFAGIIQTIASMDEAARSAAETAYDDLDFEDLDLVAEDVRRALGEYGAQIGTWSCQTGCEDEPWTAGPWLDHLSGRWRQYPGASEIALAVLARDFGLITARDFEALTSWWTAAGLPLPEPREGARFAVDSEEVERNAERLGDAMYRVEGWPLAAVVPTEAG